MCIFAIMKNNQHTMKLHKLIIVAAAMLAIAFSTAITANAKVKVDQDKLDTLAVRLADRLENGGWKFVPTRFTGTNNISADFLGRDGNKVVSMGEGILIYIDFIGSRISSNAATPRQMGRAIAGAAVSARYGSGLPNYVKTKGKIEEKKVTIGRKSRSVEIEIKYTVEETNLSLLSSVATAHLFVDTVNMTARLTFYNMNVDGTLDGDVQLF